MTGSSIAWPIVSAWHSPGRRGDHPRIRFEQPWDQSLLVFTAVLQRGPDRLALPPGGKSVDRNQDVLAGLRITLVLLAMFMLSEAVLSVERTGLPYLTILVDDSDSQRIADQYEKPEVQKALDELAALSRPDDNAAEPKNPTASETTRLDIAKGLILKDQAKLLSELEKQHKVRLYLVSSATAQAKVDRPTARPRRGKEQCTPDRAARITIPTRRRRPQCLDRIRGAPPSAIVLFTDGQTTEGEPLSKAAALAAKKGVPIFTVGLGSAEPARDIELTELLVDDVVFVDDTVRFQAKLLARGFEGEKVIVRLKELDPDRATRSRRASSIKLRSMRPANGEPKRVELVHHPKSTGERTFILEADKKPRELQIENNLIERMVTVRKEKLKVLFVDSEPRYEFRYLKNYLERDETIDLNIVLLSSDPAYSQQDRYALPTFPAAKDDLFAYDVVLFGDADTSFLSQSQMQNLVEFVSEKGGGVLFIAGELFNPLSYRGTPLELLLPIELADARNPTAVGTSITAFRPELTLEGRSSPIFRFGDSEASSIEIWQKLPDLFWYLEAPRKKPAALVLAEHPTAIGSDGKLPWYFTSSSGRGNRCSMPSTTPGAGGFAPATGISDGSGFKRSGLWPDQSSSVSVTPRSRPTANGTNADSRSSSASGSPIRDWPRRPATSPFSSNGAARARAGSHFSSYPEPRMFSRELCRKRPKVSTTSGSCRPRYSRARSRRPAFASSRRSTNSNASK